MKLRSVLVCISLILTSHVGYAGVIGMINETETNRVTVQAKLENDVPVVRLEQSNAACDAVVSPSNPFIGLNFIVRPDSVTNYVVSMYNSDRCESDTPPVFAPRTFALTVDRLLAADVAEAIAKAYSPRPEVGDELKIKFTQGRKDLAEKKFILFLTFQKNGSSLVAVKIEASSLTKEWKLLYPHLKTAHSPD